MPKKVENQDQNSLIDNKDDQERKIKHEILSKIIDLEILAKEAAMLGNYEEAINKSEEIIRLSIIGDLSKYIEDQQKFLNEIAIEASKDYTIKEINDVGNGIKKIYEVLIEAEKFREAHNILNDFKEKYSDISYFNMIPLIQELLQMDSRLWMKYQLSLNNEETHIEHNETDNYEEDLKEIKKLLKNL